MHPSSCDAEGSNASGGRQATPTSFRCPPRPVLAASPRLGLPSEVVGETPDMADLYPPTEPYDHGMLDGRRQPRLLGDARQSHRQARARRPRWARIELRREHRPFVQPGPLPRRAVRSARLRAEHAPRQRSGHRHERQHHAAPSRGHREAPRNRAVAALRRLVGIDADPRLRRAYCFDWISMPPEPTQGS
jgi:hypothetical protein